MVLNCIWKLWNPDVPLKSMVWLMHTFISITTFKRRWPAVWENPLVGLWLEHNVAAQRGSGLACQGIWCKCFDQPGKWTVFFSYSQSWNCRLHLANILTGEAANNCLQKTKHIRVEQTKRRDDTCLGLQHLDSNQSGEQTLQSFMRRINTNAYKPAGTEGLRLIGDVETRAVNEQGWDLPRPLWGRARAGVVPSSQRNSAANFQVFHVSMGERASVSDMAVTPRRQFPYHWGEQNKTEHQFQQVSATRHPLKLAHLRISLSRWANTPNNWASDLCMVKLVLF